MKIIFLDIDGVLNYYKTFLKQKLMWQLFQQEELELDPVMVERLATIIQATNAKIVLSSTWKLSLKNENGKIIPKDEIGKSLIESLKQAGIEIYDITPIDRKRHRGREIKAWLLAHPEVENFIILEDEPSTLTNVKQYAIITDYWNTSMPGLCDIHVKEAIERLNELKKQPKTYQKRK